MDNQDEPERDLRHNFRVRRELWIGGVALAAGLILLPLMIYAAGQLTLGPYAAKPGSGGLGAFLGDFYAGLLRGSGPVWAVVIGPYVFISFIRALILLSRHHLRPT